MTDQPLTTTDLDEIAARANAAYPGPWRWRGNTEARHLRLQSPAHGGMTVMDFARYGMNGAQPRFAIDGIMHKAEELVEYEVAAWSKDIYRKDISGITHPDAEFIAHAREDVPALVAEVRRLRAQLAAEQSAHRFTLRQRNNRSLRLQHLRTLALAEDIDALLAAAKDTLAASVDDHTGCGEQQSAAETCGRTRDISGNEYPPCARTVGHGEAYCRSAGGNAYFLAVNADQPAAGARQDGAQQQEAGRD